MSVLLANATVLQILPPVVIALMVLAAVDRKQLRWRTVHCPVCGHPRSSCTCKWL